MVAQHLIEVGYNMPAPELTVIGITGIPEIRPGADLAAFIVSSAKKQRLAITNDDILVVTQKVVSKAEGQEVKLAEVKPSLFALDYAKQWGKDPRQIEIVLRESKRIVKMDIGVLITQTHHGFICANSGVDMSNASRDGVAMLLPKDPDASARSIRSGIEKATGRSPAVIISDTFGRPWRDGQTNVAIGIAGMDAMADYRGQKDTRGAEMKVTLIAVADELASAAELVMGKTLGVPAALVRGYKYKHGEGTYKTLLYRPEIDLFR